MATASNGDKVKGWISNVAQAVTVAGVLGIGGMVLSLSDRVIVLETKSERVDEDRATLKSIEKAVQELAVTMEGLKR